MRALTLGSRSTWAAVVQDLLSVSPNMRIAHAAPHAPTAELHRFALGFARVHASLSHPKPTSFRPGVTDFDDGGGMLTYRLLPGLPYAVLASRDGTVRVVSTSLWATASECRGGLPERFYAPEADIAIVPFKRSGLGMSITVTWTREHGFM
jgi:hypothetical protein